MNLQRMDAEQVAGSEAVDALMFLAAYHKVRIFKLSSSFQRLDRREIVSDQLLLQLDAWYLMLVRILCILFCCCCLRSCRTRWDDHVALQGTLLLPRVTAHKKCATLVFSWELLCSQEQGTLAMAEGLCMRLLDYGASSKERAKALLREIRALQVCLQSLPAGPAFQCRPQ